MANVVEAMNAAWGAWFAFLRQLSVDEDEPRRQVRGRLLRLCDRHPDDRDHLQTVLGCLSKGKHLVEAAVRWENPVAGPRPDTDGTATDRARGEQFRLVMAHGGLETFLGALLLMDDRSQRDEVLGKFLGQCALGPYEPLPAPSRDLTELTRWLGFEEEHGQHPLTAFLKLNPSDARTLRAWMLDGHAVADWLTALRLARALRNCTVHGALSASKVCRWGLRPVLQTLAENIGAIVAGSLGVLSA
jgi:hypothetical protein